MLKNSLQAKQEIPTLVKLNKVFLLTFSFIFSVNVFAVEMRQYCFNRSVSLDRVKNYLSQIKLEKDIITLNRARHCIAIGVDEGRVELFQKYLSMNYQFTTSGNQNLRKRECRFEVETIRDTNRKKHSLKLGSKIHINGKNANHRGKSVSNIRVMENKLAQLFVNDTLVSVSCQIIGKFTEVSISLGNKRTSIITTIQVVKGQRVDLGSVVQDLSGKDSGASLSGGINYSKTTGSKKSSVFLTLK